MSNINKPIQFFLLTIMSLKLLYLCDCNGEFNATCFDTEREALLKFKGNLSDSLDQLHSWVGKDCCKWSGVICSITTGNVIKLELSNLELGGEISPSLLDLEYLEYLDLSINSFEGIQIPEFIGSLKKLTYLNLSSASFGGIITPHLGNLSTLLYLDLYTPPDSLVIYENTELHWVSSLSSLTYLNLGGADLSGASTYWLQTINMLPSLSVLHLPFCGLSLLPSSLPFVNFTALSILDLSNNGFSSVFPRWLFNLTTLSYLDLNSNSFQDVLDPFSDFTSIQYIDLSKNYVIGGQLSRNLGKLCTLQSLDLSFNSLSGEITEFINALSECTNSSLETLDLGYNDLRGFLPESLGYLNNLKDIQLVENEFTGSIPKSIGNLSSLQYFSLYENKMNGNIPESLGELSALVVLDLSENSWESVITEAHFSNLKSLKELVITLKPSLETTLVFNVSSEWLPPFKLTYIKLALCQVGHKFPSWFRNQNELSTIILKETMISDRIPDWFLKLGLRITELDLSYNQLSGPVPNSFEFLDNSNLDLSSNQFEGPLPPLSSNLSLVYLYNNRFTGTIPYDIGERMPKLANFDVSLNSLNGSIPLSVGELQDLTSFTIASNNFTGIIPDIWNNKTSLYILDLSNNSLSGEIPSSIGSLSRLQFLLLSGNNLSGEVPSLENCTEMDNLDLGDNKLTGRFPSWIVDSMPTLLILRLRSNLLSGSIPSRLCSLSSLHILDLAHNNFSGILPSCLGNLSGMASEPKDEKYEGALLTVVLKGRELIYKSTLYLVNSIDLSRNNLTGSIPELTNVSRLGTLNLSINHLTGKIPQSIGMLQRLETLDLSMNDLSGPIPPSMTSLTSLNHLNLSYNNLSGEIPTSNQFLSLNDPSIYQNNPLLCGLPLTTKCRNGDETFHSPGSNNDKEDDEFEMTWFYISMGPGFVVGFWGVCGTLLIKQSWRRAYFQFFDDIKDKMLTFLSLNVTHTQRELKWGK